MKTLKYFLILSFSSLIFQGCEDVIPVEVDEGEEYVVIEGQITNQPGPHTIKITRNAPYFQVGSTPRVTGATVIINDVADNPEAGNSFTLIETEPGIYQTDSTYMGETGTTYYLTVTINGITYNAQDLLAPVEQLDSIQIRKKARYDDLVGIFLYGNETPGIGDFYKFDIYTDGNHLDDPKKLIVVDDEFVDGNYIDDFEIYNDTWYYYDDIDEAILKPGVEVIVTSSSLSETAYIFFDRLWTISNNTGFMFDPPPANPPGNISNGAIGLFYASAVSTAPAVIVPNY